MKDFAKLYRADDVGQVLCTAEPGDEGPAMAITFVMPQLGRCSVKLSFPDNDHGWDLAYKALGEINEETALKLVREQLATSPFNKLIAARA